MNKKIQVFMNAKEVGQTIMKIQNKQKNNGDPWNKNGEFLKLMLEMESRNSGDQEVWKHEICTRNILIRFL